VTKFILDQIRLLRTKGYNCAIIETLLFFIYCLRNHDKFGSVALKSQGFTDSDIELIWGKTGTGLVSIDGEELSADDLTFILKSINIREDYVEFYKDYSIVFKIFAFDKGSRLIVCVDDVIKTLGFSKEGEKNLLKQFKLHSTSRIIDYMTYFGR